MANDILEKDINLVFPQFIILKASAGSGKTHTLTKRLVQFLLSDRVCKNDIRNILAITFSNNAAKAMKEKTLEWLKAVCLNEEDKISELSEIISIDKKELIKKAERLIDNILDNYSDLQIKTIDSFMASIFKSSAIDFGYNPDYEILMSNDLLMEYSFSYFLSNVKEGSNEAELLKEIIPHIIENKDAYPWNPSKILLKEIKEIYRKLSSTWNEVQIDDYAEESRKIKDGIKDIAEKINAAIEKSGLERSENSSFEKILSDISDNRFSDLIERGLKNPPVKKSKGKDNQKQEYYDNINKMWEAMGNSIREYVSCYAKSYYFPYLKVYEAVRETVEKVKRQEGKIFIEDINKKLAEYLDKEIIPDIYFRLGETISHYLIDEFQDTSPIQWKNLFLLVENSLSEDGSLFIVGDTKQAIYSFRDADYEIMKRLESKNPFVSADYSVKELETNHRSFQKIIDFNDKVFKENIFGNSEYNGAGEASGLTDFKQQVKLENKNKGYVEVNLHEKNDDAQFEKLKVQELVKELKERGYSYGDIAILTFENDDVVNATSWLNEKGIPFISYSSLDIRRRKITNEIISLLKFLDSPIDDLSFATFILGDIFREVLKKDKTEDKLREFIFNNTDNPPLYKAFKNKYEEMWNRYFNDLFKSIGYMPLYDIVTEIFNVFKIFEIYKKEEATLIKLLEVIKNYEGKGNNNLRAFLEFASDDDRGEAEWNIDVPKGINAVRVMTVHKAKGLGFPVVIAMLYGKHNKGFDYIPYKDNDSNKVNLLRINSNIAGKSEYLGEIYNKLKVKEDVNRLNSLYVGLTRAEAEMYIIGVNKKRECYNPSEFLPHSEYKPTDKPIAESRKNEDDDKGHITPLHYNLKSVSVSVSKNTHTVKKDKMRGEFIHRVLYFIDCLTNNYEKEIEEAIHKAQNETGNLYSDDEIKRILTNHIRKDEIMGYFLQKPGRTIRREQEFLDTAGNLLRMDRIIIDENIITVMDFKTGKESNEEDKRQINNYMDILRGIYPDKKIEGIITYIDLGKIVRIR